MTWLYIKSESQLWTVGFYKPDGEWAPESDHESAAAAAARVHWLNGGKNAREAAAPELLEALQALTEAADRSCGLTAAIRPYLATARFAIAKAKGE